MAEDPLITHSRARVGRTLRGKWTLDRLIGVGGMAAVYEATHRNGSKVAIKMLHPNLMYETNFAARLVQEGYVANKINHPAAVKVHDDDTDETDGAVFLVMELLAGHPLSVVRRQRKRFPELEALKMMSPVLECLGNAHKVGIVHRDIKPENLFVQPDGQVRVLDFGIARVSDGSNVTATRTGMVVGSPAYMSPEQALGKMNQVGPQTDVYAVGATLFALISGTTPHAGESTQEMIVLVATQSARPLMSVMPEVNPRVAQIVDRALAYDKDQRYADAFAMLAEVRACIAMLESGGPPPRTLPTFADSDDDEGATQVAPAMRAGGPASNPNTPAQAPLPNAGMNRMGLAPPMAPAQDPPPPASRVRAPTMAPVGSPGAPPPTQAMEAFPVPMGPAPVSAPPPPPAPMGPDPFAPLQGVSSTGQNPLAVPVLNPLAPADVGSASGQRPGVNTGMAWAGPPTATGEAPSPKPSSKKGIAIAGAAVALLALAVGAKFALTDDPPPAPPAPSRAAHAPPAPSRAVTPPPTPSAPIAAPAPSVAPPVLPTPSVAPVVEPPPEVPAPSVAAPSVAPQEAAHPHGGHGHHARDNSNTAAPSATPTTRTGRGGHGGHGGHGATTTPGGGSADLGY